MPVILPRSPHRLALSSLVVITLWQPGSTSADVTGKSGTELRLFPQSPSYPEQTDALSTSLYVEPELYLEWSGGELSLLATPFLRVDQDDRRRSHADMRELYLRARLSSAIELRAGVARVFWGVTESKHLVNVLNQVDLVEGPDAESYLGQPLLQLTWIASERVTLDVFALSGFRERTFPGAGGRLRGPVPVSDDATYQSRLARGQPEGAVRLAWAPGTFELGLHYFFGTRRDPELRLAGEPDDPVVRPHYRLMHRVGVDAVLAVGDILFKLEAIGRTDSRGRDLELAATGGLEYTLVGVVGALDLGLLLEYSRDGRDPLAALFLEDDVFAGLRLAFNDVQSTELLLGGALHSDASSTLIVAEASRRLDDSFSLALEARFFVATEPERPEYPLRHDGHVQAELTAYF